jgi:lipopolysaccharide transport system ATP-binding protein
MPSNHIAIRVSHLSKQYRLGGLQEPYHTLRDAIVNSLKAPMKVFHKDPPMEGFWALRDVSFEVEQGEVLGIIGRNGAGKSTLLKILSRVTTPTEGTIEIHGRVGSLLEVGTGFHPEMTGRENIFLNGSILGMKRTEIEQKFDEIVRFAEIEKFIDTPVKRYSSGMYVRLAFAVAAHLEPEILVVDEVLAVGDAAFQKKCLGKMGEVAKEGRTVLFVSHNMKAVSGLCNRAILIDKGTILTQGSTDKVIQDYHHRIQKETTMMSPDIFFPTTSTNSAQIERIRFMNNREELSLTYDSLEPITIIINYNIFNDFPHLLMWFEIRNIDGTMIFASSDSDWKNFTQPDENEMFSKKKGSYETRVTIPAPLLNEGRYEFEVYLTLGPSRVDTKKGILFEVVDHDSFISYVRKSSRGGTVCIPLEWHLKAT